jgi:hypothetical protein
MTPVHKSRTEPGMTYVVCLDCGQHFHYDLDTMSMGKVISASFGTPRQIKSVGPAL